MIRILLVLLVVSALLSGCSTVIEDDFIFQTPAERVRAVDAEQNEDDFEMGFLNGCLALVYFTAPSEDEVLPFDQALAMCSEVRTLAGSDRLRESKTTAPIEPEHQIDCSRGNCL